MTTKAKLNERLAFSAPDEWVSMAEYRQVVAVGNVAAVSPAQQVSVQLRKATSAGGANADDHGDPVLGDRTAVAQAYVSDLGETVGGVPYTHVSAVILAVGSPAADVGGAVIRGDGRFNP